MAGTAPYADSEALRRAVLGAGLLIPAGVDGVFHRSGVFEDTVAGVSRHVRRFSPGAPDEPDLRIERRALPPIVARADWLRTDYLRAFPDLMGSIGVFRGGDRDHRRLIAALEDGEDWTAQLEPAEVVVSSSACHGLYGTLDPAIPGTGHLVDLTTYCFRHEPSLDPARMVSFRQHEFVRVGTPGQAGDHAAAWREAGPAALAVLGLEVDVVVAHDPFFGRVGTMLAGNQEEAALKHELVIGLTGERLTAIASVNLHEDHFGGAFGLTTPDGSVAHSACIGFGLERVTLALFAVHGLDPAQWPESVRSAVA